MRLLKYREGSLNVVCLLCSRETKHRTPGHYNQFRNVFRVTSGISPGLADRYDTRSEKMAVAQSQSRSTTNSFEVSDRDGGSPTRQGEKNN